MTIRTYTLINGVGTVTIGWANVAQYPAFERWLTRRLANGYNYKLYANAKLGRTVLYNAAMAIIRVTPAEIRGASATDSQIAKFLLAGDISLVRLDHADNFITARQPLTVIELLDHDVIEVQHGKASSYVH